MKWEDIADVPCPIARSSAVLGDRWTLVILRDCFLGVRRFEDFQRRLGISRTTLAERLRRLERHGVLTAETYQRHPARHEYRLTDKGRDLYPVLSTLLSWGDKYYPDDSRPTVVRRHKACGHDVDPVLCCPECRRAVGPRDIEARLGKPEDRRPRQDAPPETTAAG